MIQTMVIKRAKDIFLSPSLERFACLVHHSPPLILLFNLPAFSDLPGENEAPPEEERSGWSLIPLMPSGHIEPI